MNKGQVSIIGVVLICIFASIILANITQNHPGTFSIVDFTSEPLFWALAIIFGGFLSLK